MSQSRGSFEIGRICPDQPHIRRRVHDVLRYVQPPGWALDVGCGRGEVSMLLARHGFQCMGVDREPRLICHLQEHFSAVQWRCVQADLFDADGSEFDVITLYHVLEHVPDPVDCLKRIARLAKTGALIVVEVPNVGGLKARLQGRRWDYYHAEHLSYFRPRDLRGLAGLCGLKVVGFKGYQHFSYPQDVLWKDVIKGSLAAFGFRDVISIFMRVEK